MLKKFLWSDFDSETSYQWSSTNSNAINFLLDRQRLHMIDYQVSIASLSNDNVENYYENIKWEKLEDSVNSDQETCRL